MKKSKRRRIVIILALALICFGGWQACWLRANLWVASLQVIHQEFVQTSQPAEWLLTEKFEGNDLHYEATELTSFIDLLARFPWDSQVAEIQEIRRAFGTGFSVSIYASNSYRFPMEHQTLSQFRGDSPNQITFFTQPAMKIIAGPDPLPLFYYHPLKSVFMAGIRYGDVRMFHAMIAHELRHSLQGTPRDKAAQYQGEAEAHRVGQKLLDESTQGAYMRRIREVVESKGWCWGLRHFFLKVRPKDLRRIDELFSRGSSMEQNLRANQYLLDLGFEWLRQHSSPQELSAKQMDCYRMIYEDVGGDRRLSN